MAEDSGGLLAARMPDGRPLFEFGNPQQRRLGLLHSVLLVLGSFFAAGLFVSLGGGLLAGLGISGESTLGRVSDSVIQFSMLIAIPLAYLFWRGERSLVEAATPSVRDVGMIVVGAVVLIGFMSVGEMALSALGYEPAANATVEYGRENPELFLYYIPIVLLLNAPAEELLFRGVVQGLLRRAYGVVPGILGAAAIFGLLHYSALVASGSAGAYILLALGSGIILGSLYELTENLVVPTAVHAIWNCLVYSTLYLETTGGL